MEDELVEAIELPGSAFALGVIWHPEEDRGSPLIGALVEAARGAPIPETGIDSPPRGV